MKSIYHNQGSLESEVDPFDDFSKSGFNFKLRVVSWTPVIMGHNLWLSYLFVNAKTLINRIISTLQGLPRGAMNVHLKGPISENRWNSNILFKCSWLQILLPIPSFDSSNQALQKRYSPYEWKTLAWTFCLMKKFIRNFQTKALNLESAFLLQIKFEEVI